MSPSDQAQEGQGRHPKAAEPVRIALPPEFYAMAGAEAKASASAGGPRAKRGVPALHLKDVDLNTATPEELTKGLEGVGEGLAYQIVREREQRGPFLDLHDLGRVPGVGPRTFERLTGLPWREGVAGCHEEVLKILSPSDSHDVHLKGVAKRLSELPGFDGCIIAHEEGYILESCWDNPARESLGVFAPQFMKKLLPYIQKLGLGSMDSLTIFVAERPITLVQCRDLIIVAIHAPNRFSRRQVRLAQHVISKLRVLLVGEHPAAK